MGVCSSLRGTKDSRQNRAFARSCPLKQWNEFGLQLRRRRSIRQQYHVSSSPMGASSGLARLYTRGGHGVVRMISIEAYMYSRLNMRVQCHVKFSLAQKEPAEIVGSWSQHVETRRK